jgi:feruloyl-CoA synthase
MTEMAFGWTPDPFLTGFERRTDGTMLMRPRAQLGTYPLRLTDALESWAEVAPDRTFVAQRDSSGAWVHVNYRDMLQRVQRVAAGLMRYDLSVERPIAILSGNSIEHLTLALAAMWVGIPYCPVSPSYSQVAGDLQKLRYVMNLLTPGLVAAFGTSSFDTALCTVVSPDIPVVGDASYSKRKVIGFESLEDAPAARDAHAHAGVGPDTIAKFLLTSGSTGNPKAVITTMRMLCSNALMLRQALPFLVDEPPVLIDWLPWNHTFGGSHNVGLVLFNGGSLYIDEGRPTPAGMTRTLRNLRDIAPTVYFNVPKGFEVLAQHLQGDAALRATFYSRLRAYFFAGASLAQHTRDSLDALSQAERGFKVPMLSGLGATETGPSVTFTTPATQRTDTIGLPAAGNVVKLVPVAGKLELRVRGPNVTPGYWRQPELTAAAFDEEGYYRLGDAVSLLDPADPTRGMRFDGRIAEDFKLASGTWVSVGPLRMELLGALAPLLQDVVIGGLNQDYLAAVLIPDVVACARLLEVSPPPAHAELARHPKLLALLRERLQEHAARHPASSMRIRRALLIPTAPSLDHGEITDKGSFNQRAVLEHRPECLAMLYATVPDPVVIDLPAAD